MIRIRVKRSRDMIEGFLVWGHARYAPYNEDIVCASVSAVCTTTIIGLINLTPGYVRYGISDGGLMYCRLRGVVPGPAHRDTQTLFMAMILGLQSIQKSYGNSIDIKIQRT